MIDSAHIVQWQSTFLIKIFMKEVLLYYMSVCLRVMLANTSENYYKKTKNNYQKRRKKNRKTINIQWLKQDLCAPITKFNCSSN